MHAKGTRNRKIQQSGRYWIGFHPASIYFDPVKLEGARDFSEECGFFLVAFDQNTFQIGNDHTNRYGGKARAGANVGEPTMAYGNLRDNKHAFAEMKAQNLDRIGNGGEGDLPIPAKQQVNIGTDGFRELRSRADPVSPELSGDEFVTEWGCSHTMYIVKSE